MTKHRRKRADGRNVLDAGIEGKSALVAGGATGIGFAIAAALAAEGANLVVVSRNPSEAAMDALRTHGTSVEAVRADLADEVQARRAVADAHAVNGAIDLLVFSAATASSQAVTRITVEEVERTLRTNLIAAMVVGGETAGRMIDAGGGSILMVGSVAQYHRAPAQASYHASKAALASYTRTLAVELAPHGIRANLLVPGSFPTALSPPGDPATEDLRLAEIPMGRRGDPDECGPAAVFLLSDRLASYITGAELVVSGGIDLRPHVRIPWTQVRELNTSDGPPDRAEEGG